MTSLEIITIFSEIRTITSTNNKKYIRENYHYLLSNEKDKIEIRLLITGKYIADENILILECKGGASDILLPAVLEKLSSKSVFIESLSQASRRCINFADRAYTDLAKLFEEENKQLPQNTGSPYR